MKLFIHLRANIVPFHYHDVRQITVAYYNSMKSADTLCVQNADLMIKPVVRSAAWYFIRYVGPE